MGSRNGTCDAEHSAWDGVALQRLDGDRGDGGEVGAEDVAKICGGREAVG